MIEIEGVEKLEKLVRLLKDAPKEFGREATKALGKVAAQIKPEVARRTDEFLPKRGGLAARVARTKLPHRLRKGSHPKVTITAKPSHTTLRDPVRVDRGRIAHPVFGMAYSRNPWQIQDVKPGWFSVPLEDSSGEVRRGLVEAIDDFTTRAENLL